MSIALASFITEHRDQLIGLCRQQVTDRSSPPATPAEIDHGVPLFLSQLSKELDRALPDADAISESARQNGGELLKRGFTLNQVVQCYGDVCQVVTRWRSKPMRRSAPTIFAR